MNDYSNLTADFSHAHLLTPNLNRILASICFQPKWRLNRM